MKKPACNMQICWSFQYKLQCLHSNCITTLFASCIYNSMNAVTLCKNYSFKNFIKHNTMNCSFFAGIICTMMLTHTFKYLDLLKRINKRIQQLCWSLHHVSKILFTKYLLVIGKGQTYITSIVYDFLIHLD